MTSFSIYPKKRELAGSFSLGDVKTEIDPFRSLKDSWQSERARAIFRSYCGCVHVVYALQRVS